MSRNPDVPSALEYSTIHTHTYTAYTHVQASLSVVDTWIPTCLPNLQGGSSKEGWWMVDGEWVMGIGRSTRVQGVPGSLPDWLLHCSGLYLLVHFSMCICIAAPTAHPTSYSIWDLAIREEEILQPHGQEDDIAIVRIVPRAQRAGGKDSSKRHLTASRV